MKIRKEFAMKKTIVVFIIISFLSFQCVGCATLSGTEKGAAGGAVAGGVLGAIFGGTKGAIIGGVVGVIVGGVVGNYYDKQVASRDEATKKYENSTKEKKIEIEDSFITPKDGVLPGTMVESNVQYTVLDPVEAKNIQIVETRTLTNGKDMIELAKREVIRSQGTHISTLKFTMPEDIDKGDYTLITTISDGDQTKTSKSPVKII